MALKYWWHRWGVGILLLTLPHLHFPSEDYVAIVWRISLPEHDVTFLPGKVGDNVSDLALHHIIQTPDKLELLQHFSNMALKLAAVGHARR
jgi:hypothetical protein